MKSEQSIAVMRTHMPMRYDAADEDPWINAVLIRARTAAPADAIEQVLQRLADAEVLEDHRDDVAQRPLLARVRRSARCRTRSATPSESLACSEPCEPPPTWCAPPQSRNS